MSQQKSAMKGVPVTIQNAASADETPGTVIAIPTSFRNHRIIIKTSAGVTAGAIQPETADANDYAGVWAPIGGGPITVPAASSEIEYQWQGIYRFFRARIETAIANGTVTVIYVGS